VQEQEQLPGQVQGRERVRGQEQARGQVQRRERVRGQGQEQGQERGPGPALELEPWLEQEQEQGPPWKGL